MVSGKEGVNTKGDYAVFAILFFTNILNYVDRYTMAGVLTGIQTDFHISDAHAGLLQTAFITALAIGSPLFGYLGDRYNRKLLIMIGMLIWTTSVLGSSFIPAGMFIPFVCMRALFGFGQAAYVTISPSLIADSFTGNKRSLMLMLYYFAIPVGSGLGFIVGSAIAGVANNDWRWGVRAPSILDAICLILIFFFVKVRKSTWDENDNVEGKTAEHSSYKSDLVALGKNATFMTSTFAYTAVVFVTGTLSWWIPTAMQHVKATDLNLTSTTQLSAEERGSTTFIFGLITIVSGFSGVAAGSVLSNFLSSGRWCFSCCSTPRSDPIICAVGTAIGAPALFAVMQLIPVSLIVAQVFMFVCITGLCFIWATNVNLYISVVTPDKRNSANGIQILLSHVLGDGSGPYIIGAISDAIRGDETSPSAHWRSLSLAFYVANILLIPAVILFIVAAITYPRDRAAFLRSTNGSMMEIDSIHTGVETGASSNKIVPSHSSPIPVKNAFGGDNHTTSSPPNSESSKRRNGKGLII
ncbi:hypothetical protein PENTCL1PPCAC_18148 [Pristionchus entomophagus]|uniref:Major facilitator superfamily (MFS) profile domain-containing protein n=1 Tax=Pristionchus entomophagus TaxID=358040 RepID=A0AAV5TNZ1_9BILA|nr:hypothetical protein PENTCL1PPCAC_18148 [Pristionchus entomophagus]